MMESTQHLLDGGYLYNIRHKRESTEVFALATALQMSREFGRRREESVVRTIIMKMVT